MAKYDLFCVETGEIIHEYFAKVLFPMINVEYIGIYQIVKKKSSSNKDTDYNPVYVRFSWVLSGAVTLNINMENL